MTSSVTSAAYFGSTVTVPSSSDNYSDHWCILLFRGWGWSGIGAAMVEVSPEIPVPIANLTHTKVLTHRSVNEMFISLVIIKKKIQRVSDRR
jgi:hypothetical protein